MIKTYIVVILVSMIGIGSLANVGQAQSTPGINAGTPSASPEVAGSSNPASRISSSPASGTSPSQGPTPTKVQDEKFNIIPSSANSEWKKVCVNKSLNLNGDFQSLHSFLGASGQWSVGPAVSTQLVKYDLAKKQAGFNTSIGAGASFRFYRSIDIKDETAGNVVDTVFVGQVRPECRQSSFGSDRKSYRAAPMFSITPTLYATKPTSEGDLAVQPAILLGFFEDILNFGVGFNMTGPAAEKGHVFLLMSIGAGFDF
jgi:hypothetical protein